jgi:hypothetical protein
MRQILKMLSAAALVVMLGATAVPLRAPVNVAHELYAGCMTAAAQTTYIESSRAAVDEFLDSADEQCFIWMVLWYQPVMGDVKNIIDWDDNAIDRLDQWRRDFYISMRREIMRELKIK